MKITERCRGVWERYWDRKLDHRREDYAHEREKNREVLTVARKMLEARRDHQVQAHGE